MPVVYCRDVYCTREGETGPQARRWVSRVLGTCHTSTAKLEVTFGEKEEEGEKRMQKAVRKEEEMEEERGSSPGAREKDQ